MTRDWWSGDGSVNADKCGYHNRDGYEVQRYVTDFVSASASDLLVSK